MMIRSAFVFALLAAMTAHAQFVPFPAGPIVDVRDYGAIPGDSVPDTPAIVAAMAGGGRTVRVPLGEYLVGTFEIPSNTVLELAPGTTLRDTGLLGITERLINIHGVNVRILGQYARVIADRTAYTTGEFRHGVFIFGARNVEIVGLESSHHGGDGFYLGKTATDVTISGCAGNFNRRQGMSIVSARNLRVTNCRFFKTFGTNPQFGVDIEPNNNGDVLQNIELSTIRTEYNAGGGVAVGLTAYTSVAPPVSIKILDHLSLNESVRFYKVGLRTGDVLIYRARLIDDGTRLPPP